MKSTILFAGGVGTVSYFTGAVVPAPVMAAGLIVFVGVPLLWYRRTRSAATVGRWADRSRRRDGMASTMDIARRGSARAVRRKATVIRPSLRKLTRRQRARLTTPQVGTLLCRVGPQGVWASLEDVVTMFGPPRSGKSGALAGRIIDAPGAVVSTSTRLDLMKLTGPLRATHGRRVWLFNAGDVAGLKSTISFDPLTGCTDPVRAAERAVDMIPESTGEGERWDGHARRVLAVLLYAAASAGPPVGMSAVLEWVSSPDNPDYQKEILGALRQFPDSSYVPVVQQFLKTNDRTRSSITSSIMPALAWLMSPAAVAATTGPNRLNVTELLANRDTIYLIGKHEAQTAALLAALTGYIAREARRLAAYQPGGRLDPALMLALDEAAVIAPVPLPEWTSDMGGFGLHIFASFQSRADLYERWGKAAAKIINNSGAIVLFGGTKDEDDGRAWAALAGDRDERVETCDESGTVTSWTVRKVPILPPAQLSNLPDYHVVVWRRGMAPVIGRVRMAWRRHDVRNTLWWRLVGARWAAWRAGAQPAPNLTQPAPNFGQPSPAFRPASPNGRANGHSAPSHDPAIEH